MRWLKPNLRTGIYGFLGFHPPLTDSMLERGTEDVRDSMLALLGDSASTRFPQITWRIRYAADILALWYLRGELMGALSEMQGEAIARDQIDKVTHMFDGLLPNGLHSRSTLLG